MAIGIAVLALMAFVVNMFLQSMPYRGGPVNERLATPAATQPAAPATPEVKYQEVTVGVISETEARKRKEQQMKKTDTK